MKTNESTALLAENNELFHFQTSEGDGSKDIFIDFASILTFYIDSSYDNTALVVKLRNETKATYIFSNEDDFTRFVKEYNAFIKVRGSLEYISKQMLNEIVGTLKEEVERTTKASIQEALKDIQSAFVDEVKTFKSAVREQADVIVETALEHQVKINKQNSKQLEVVEKMISRSDVALERFEAFSERIEGFVSAIDLIAPANDKDVKEADLNASTLNKETESA